MYFNINATHQRLLRQLAHLPSWRSRWPCHPVTHVLHKRIRWVIFFPCPIFTQRVGIRKLIPGIQSYVAAHLMHPDVLPASKQPGDSRMVSCHWFLITSALENEWSLRDWARMHSREWSNPAPNLARRVHAWVLRWCNQSAWDKSLVSRLRLLPGRS